MGQTQPSERRGRWPLAVRARAEDLARDRDMSVSEIRRALAEELSADVPIDSVARWVKDLRRREPIDRVDVLRDVADRTALLLSAEVDRLERQTPKTRDLARVDAVAKTLKTLSSVDAGKSTSGRQTLQSVARLEASDGSRDASSLGTEPNPGTSRRAA